MADRTPLHAMRQWMLSQCLPKWAITGFDPVFGGFRERLDMQAQPVAASPPYRLITQSRQIYTYSHAALLGWFPTGRDVAAMALETARRHYRSPDGQPGYVFSVHPDGTVADARRDAYSHAFILFALAWHHKLTGDPALVDEAHAILRFFDTALAAPNGAGFMSNTADAAGLRLQNPHMHLFEAMLAWHDATGDARFLARAGEIFGLFTSCFFQPGTATLSEYFDAAWLPVAGDKGQLWEPGHHYEWVWLLRTFARATGRDAGRYARVLYDRARAAGHLPDGRVVDECLGARGHHKPSTRLWPHTEWLKAASAEFEAGDAEAEGTAMTALTVMQDRFCRPDLHGGWSDHLDQTGQPIVDYMPASSLYHVFLAMTEAERVFGG